MRTRTLSGAVYTGIAWLPMLAIVFAVGWVLAVGVLHLEINSYGTEFFVSNDDTSNVLPTLGSRADGDAAALQAALDSGDPQRMSAALDQLEARTAPR